MIILINFALLLATHITYSMHLITKSTLKPTSFLVKHQAGHQQKRFVQFPQQFLEAQEKKENFDTLKVHIKKHIDNNNMVGITKFITSQDLKKLDNKQLQTLFAYANYHLAQKLTILFKQQLEFTPTLSSCEYMADQLMHQRETSLLKLYETLRSVTFEEGIIEEAHNKKTITDAFSKLNGDARHEILKTLTALNGPVEII
ncbi:MAG: hypothetical protein M1114_05270 [Candidatus Dependentiae bacterium]|nr:hypothetical protein [Candidatus Dependentiae bacterium]